jgi:hypothetical protein
VQHGLNGLLFDPGDPADLARQMARLAEEPDLLDRLKAHLLPFRSVDEELDDLEAIYASAGAP